MRKINANPKSNSQIYELYLLLKENKPFMLARYNDGEFIAITQWDFIRNCSTDKIHGNIDGHKYFPEMGTVLREAILSDENRVLAENKKYFFQTKLEGYKNYYKTLNFNIDSLNNIKFV